MKHLTPAERSRKWREESVRACASCGRTMQIKGKGLCATCYNREWRKTDKAKAIIKTTNAARNGRRKRNGKNIWGSNLWHELASRPCEICGWDKASRDIHHIHTRAEGGASTAANMVTLCPNHHRLVHEDIIPAVVLEDIVKQRDADERHTQEGTNMKTVTVSIEGRAASQVRLNNAVDSDALTARMATEARNIAAGVSAYATVTDGTTTYRVTRSGTRKVAAEE